MSFKYTKKIIPASIRFENNGDAPIFFRNPYSWRVRRNRSAGRPGTAVTFFS